MPDSPTAPPETLRLHQANERTMLAWIRTGIALMAFGFAIARFGVFLRQVASLGQVSVHLHGVGSAWVGAALVALGMVANLLATVRYAQIRRASSAATWERRTRSWSTSSASPRRSSASS